MMQKPRAAEYEIVTAKIDQKLYRKIIDTLAEIDVSMDEFCELAFKNYIESLCQDERY